MTLLFLQLSSWILSAMGILILSVIRYQPLLLEKGQACRLLGALKK